LAIFYNNNIINTYKASDDYKKEKAEYEIKYGKYEKATQPQINKMLINADIYPEQKELHIDGEFVLVNKTNNPVESIFLNILNSPVINNLSLNQGSRIIVQDNSLGVHIFKLDNPLNTGDSITLKFDFDFPKTGFSQNGLSTDIVNNGTFFISDNYTPVIGYEEHNVLTNNITREKFGLAPYTGWASPDDGNALNKAVFSYADYEAIISTSGEQTAITAGKLINKWKKEGRNYFHYKSDEKIVAYVPFLSAKYEVKKAKYITIDNKEISIDIYFHKSHPYNLETFIEASKLSLDYFIENYGAYPYDQIKIVEFPRFLQAAVSLPGVIPFSESIGFIAKIDEESINYPFQVLSHELAHVWWGHMVLGAKVKGMPLMMEPMAQYSSLMVLEKKYGKKKVNKFLEYELDSYLQSRGKGIKSETPLRSMERTEYLWYKKGSIVMNCLKEYLGEKVLNKSLREYLDKVKYQEPPYSTADEFISYLRQAAPDSLQYLVTDLFENITLYDNKVNDVVITKSENNSYKVAVDFNIAKYYSDSIGNETACKLNDYIHIGIYDKGGNEIYYKLHKFESNFEKLEFKFDKQPYKVSIDPYPLLIDRDRKDNFKKIE